MFIETVLHVGGVWLPFLLPKQRERWNACSRVSSCRDGPFTVFRMRMTFVRESNAHTGWAAWKREECRRALSASCDSLLRMGGMKFHLLTLGELVLSIHDVRPALAWVGGGFGRTNLSGASAHGVSWEPPLLKWLGPSALPPSLLWREWGLSQWEVCEPDWAYGAQGPPFLC